MYAVSSIKPRWAPLVDDHESPSSTSHWALRRQLGAYYSRHGVHPVLHRHSRQARAEPRPRTCRTGIENLE
ncbi:MAG: hypothetical protein CMJ59_01860 [Planctomycetaceae bacterium]|nr:hypothetical protein [Planctomycetaceae bacterium]